MAMVAKELDCEVKNLIEGGVYMFRQAALRSEKSTLQVAEITYNQTVNFPLILVGCCHRMI